MYQQERPDGFLLGFCFATMQVQLATTAALERSTRDTSGDIGAFAESQFWRTLRSHKITNLSVMWRGTPGPRNLQLPNPHTSSQTKMFPTGKVGSKLASCRRRNRHSVIS